MRRIAVSSSTMRIRPSVVPRAPGSLGRVVSLAELARRPDWFSPPRRAPGVSRRRARRSGPCRRVLLGRSSSVIFVRLKPSDTTVSIAPGRSVTAETRQQRPGLRQCGGLRAARLRLVLALAAAPRCAELLGGTVLRRSRRGRPGGAGPSRDGRLRLRDRRPARARRRPRALPVPPLQVHLGLRPIVAAARLDRCRSDGRASSRGRSPYPTSRRPESIDRSRSASSSTRSSCNSGPSR